MYGPIEGSSPRVTIKRTHNRNPTFHSFHVFGALHFDEEEQVPERRERARKKEQRQVRDSVAAGWTAQKDSMPQLIPRGKSEQTMDFDSLYRAEKEFSVNKVRNPLYYVANNTKDVPKQLQAPRSRSSNFLPVSDDPHQPLHFGKDSIIRQKQQIGYDIINGLPHT